MSKLLCLLFVAAALVGAGGVQADVGPPVQVHIMGEPRAAEPGVPFKGQLKIEAGESLRLEDLQFTGLGWRQVDLDVGPVLSIDKAGSEVIDFEVIPSDAGQPLELTFTVDGDRVTRHFDLSPAAIAFVRGPNPVEKMPDEAGVPPLTEATAVKPGPAPSADDAPTPQNADKGRSIRVSGRFVYVRSDGWTIGADGMTVRVYDNDGLFGSPQLASVATDAQGYYDVTFWWGDDVFDPQPDIYVRFESANTRIQTESTAWLAGPYAWETGTIDDFAGTDLNFGTLRPSDINQYPAVHIQTILTRTWRWWLGYGYDTPFVRANWPDGDEGAYYNGEIYFSTGEQWNENVASHEHGHHWVQTFALSPAPAYCNGVCDDPGNCGHCIWCAETANVSFTEGFPDWMGDVIPGSFQASYGRAALAIYDMENVSTCDGFNWADPTMTEGFLGALVRDIGDATNDDHTAFPETDELSTGYGPVIACVDQDHPTTATAFLSAFKARFPGYKEGLWATARNCNYETDVLAPPAVTGLYSPSHSTSGNSPDPTIDLAWTRAVDDASGVRGYAVMIAGGIGLPSAVQNIGDVTGYTTASLAPGTYYFSIRTLDRSGKWSGTYAWNGPYVIRAPVPANLAFYQYPGWSAVLVPRGSADATAGSVPEPTSLPGNMDGTWWNAGLWNSGESSTGGGFQARCYVDGDWQYWASWGELGSGYGLQALNLGPFAVRGGRHTFETRLDALDEVAETNEGDNRWAHQWIWSPLALPGDTPITRVAPPLKTAGWEAVNDGSALYLNSDGLRMTPATWWDAAVLRPLSATADHDLYLHDPSTGPANGFGNTLATSGRVSGLLDAVIVNRNVVGWGNYDVGVVNYDGDPGNYAIAHALSSSLAFGDSVIVPFATNQMLRIWEVYVAPERVGPVSVTLDVDPAEGPLVAQWLDKNYVTGGINTYFARGTTNVSGRARMDMTIAEAGYHALVVYRDPTWSKTTGPINVTIEIDTTPPDFIPLFAAGWHSPLVPRAAFDGTLGSVPVPASLPGNVASTYLNLAVRNNSPSSSPAGLPGQMYLDGVFAWWVAWGAFPANTDGLFNWNAAWVVRGGRHMLSLNLDANQEIEEIQEDNNIYGEQWVWSPLDLVHDTPVLRPIPPDPYGDWTTLSSGEAFYPNCDGLRLPDAGGWWRAVATMPAAGSDVDVRLHPASTGAKDGFADNIAGSYWWEGLSDYVLVNFNLAPGGFQPYDAGIVRYNGTGNYTAEATAADISLTYPDGVYGPFSLPAGRILNLIEVYLPARQTGIHLMNLTGSVDWGLSLHRADLAYQGKSDVVGTVSEGFGLGQNELLAVDVPAEGWYCIAVWKKGAADLPQAGTYNLVIRPMSASGVDDELPTVTSTALVAISPNPFNPQTKITYDLAREGLVKLEVYDVQGRLVRTLINGSRGAGRHTETWNGINDAGGQVASGIYLARMTSSGVTQMKKMTLLK